MQKNNNLGPITMQSWKISKYFLYLIFLSVFLSACGPNSEEEIINSINKRIAPEGYLTSQYLYIDWPALYDGNDEVAEPLKLKLPIEYLVPSISSKKKSSIEYVEDSLFISNHKITMISLQVLPEGKPYSPVIANSSISQEEDKQSAERLKSSYAIHIMRDPYFKDRDLNASPNNLIDIQAYGKFLQEGSVAGLDRYVQTHCFDIDKERKLIGGVANPDELQKDITYINSKAKDDHSPQNCYEDRGWQYLVPTNGSTFLKSALYINCSTTGCIANLNLKNRLAQINVSNENTAYQYVAKIGNSPEYIQRMAAAKAAENKDSIHLIPQPMLDEIFTDLPNWDKKVEFARDLLNASIARDIPFNSKK